MKVLFDHCVPRPLRKYVIGHAVSTTEDLGWSDKDNGDLLALAATQFEAFVTIDQNIQYQQNLAALPLPVIIFVSVSNRLDALIPFAPSLLAALQNVGSARLQRIEPDFRIVKIA